MTDTACGSCFIHAFNCLRFSIIIGSATSSSSSVSRVSGMMDSSLVGRSSSIIGGRAITVGEASFGSSRFVFWVRFSSVRFVANAVAVSGSSGSSGFVSVRRLSSGTVRFGVFLVQVSSFISLT